MNVSVEFGDRKSKSIYVTNIIIYDLYNEITNTKPDGYGSYIFLYMILYTYIRFKSVFDATIYARDGLGSTK